MGKVVTLGEIMLRLSTPGNTRFVRSEERRVVKEYRSWRPRHHTPKKRRHKNYITAHT